MNWIDWTQAYWHRLRNAWSIARSGVSGDELQKALRPPMSRLLEDRNSVERKGLHRSPYELYKEPGGEGPRKPFGVPFYVLRTFARKNWAVRACIALRQREVAGANWEIVPDLDRHINELQTIYQLAVAANKYPEREKSLSSFSAQWLHPKKAKELISAIRGKTPAEIKYMCRLAQLDITLEAEKHAAAPRRLLEYPNQTRTWDDLLRPFVDDLYVVGLGALELRRDASSRENGISTPGDEILEMHWLDAATLRPVLNEYGDYMGDIEHKAVSWEQWINDQKVGPGFRSCDILEVMEFPQSDVAYRGYSYSRIETLLPTLELEARGDVATLKKFQRETYGKGLHMKGVPGMNSQEDLDAYRAYYEAEFESSYKMPIFVTGKEGEVKGVDLTMNPSTGDKWSVELHKQFMVRTCAVMDVPPFKIGITDDVNRATALGSAEMADEGLDSLLRLLETTFTRKIVQDFGYPHLKMKAVRRNEDPKDTLERLQREMDLHLITVNDALIERGDAPLDDGDVPLIYRKTLYEEKARSDAQADMGEDESGDELFPTQELDVASEQRTETGEMYNET